MIQCLSGLRTLKFGVLDSEESVRQNKLSILLYALEVAVENKTAPFEMVQFSVYIQLEWKRVEKERGSFAYFTTLLP